MWGKVLIFGGGLVAGIIAKMIHNEAKSTPSGQNNTAEPVSAQQAEPTQAEKNRAEQEKLENDIHRMQMTLRYLRESVSNEDEGQPDVFSEADKAAIEAKISVLKAGVKKAQARLDELNAEMDSESQTVQEVPAAEPETETKVCKAADQKAAPESQDATSDALAPAIA